MVSDVNRLRTTVQAQVGQPTPLASSLHLGPSHSYPAHTLIMTSAREKRLLKEIKDCSQGKCHSLRTLLRSSFDLEIADKVSGITVVPLSEDDIGHLLGTFPGPEVSLLVVLTLLAIS